MRRPKHLSKRSETKMLPNQPYISKSERVNPNVRAAGGDLVHGDKAPRGGDPPGERVRTNPSSAGAASQAPGASAIADKSLSAEDLHELAVKARNRGDQQQELELLAAENSVRSGHLAKSFEAFTVGRMALQGVRFAKRHGVQIIVPEASATSASNSNREFRKALSPEREVLVDRIKALAKKALLNKRPDLCSALARLELVVKAGG
jgi:hypothetical protein